MFKALLNIVSDNGKPDFTVGPSIENSDTVKAFLMLFIGIIIGVVLSQLFPIIINAFKDEKESNNTTKQKEPTENSKYEEESEK